MRIVILFFLLPFISFGQTSYRGTVKDKSNNAVIPFATVGLIKENTGTTADENGIFQLNSIKSFPDDSLIITCLGYNDFKINVLNIDTSKIEILLIAKSFNLNEIVVSKNKKPKTEILNDFSKSSNAFETSTGYVTQIAQHFQVQNTDCQLMKVKICDGSLIFGKTGRYRLRINSMDLSTKSPSNDLCNDIIEVKTKYRRDGIYSINLEKYKIIIPGKDFFIAIEWLKFPPNYFKKMFQYSGGYLPTIGHTPKTDLTLESWQLDYNNSWIPRQSTLLISATIKN